MPTLSLTSTAELALKGIQPSPQLPIYKKYPARIDTHHYGKHVIICLSGAHRDPDHMKHIVEACRIADEKHVKSLKLCIEGWENADKKTNPSEVQAWQQIATAIRSKQLKIELTANPGIVRPSPDDVAQKHPDLPIAKQLLCWAELETIGIGNNQLSTYRSQQSFLHW
jgi:hypothetical protein